MSFPSRTPNPSQYARLGSADLLYSVEPREYYDVRMNSMETGYMPASNTIPRARVMGGEMNKSLYKLGAFTLTDSIEAAWHWWKERLMPVTLGDRNLFRQQHLIHEAYVSLAAKEIESASPPENEEGEIVTLAPHPEHIKLCLDVPIDDTLVEMKKYILLSVGEHDGFMGLLRLTVALMDSISSTIYGGTIRTEGLDNAIVSILEEFVETAEKFERESKGMEVDDGFFVRYALDRNNINVLFSKIYEVLATAPVLFIAKASPYNLEGAPSFVRRNVVFAKPGQATKKNQDIEWSPFLMRPLPQEYRVLSYLNGITSSDNLTIFPVAYALKRTKKRSYRHEGENRDSMLLLDALSNSPASELDSDVLYMQYLEGSTLEEVASVLPESLLNATVGYLHHILAYLKKRCEFAHGDLKSSKVVLWGYGPGLPKRAYELPLIDEEGETLDTITLPFRPMLVGLEHASTSLYSQYGPTTSTHPGELADIICMYTSDVRMSGTVGFSLVKERLSPYYYEFRQDLSHSVEWRLPPYGWAIEGLSHKILSEYYREKEVFAPYSVSRPSVMQGFTLQYKENSRSDSEKRLGERALALLAFFESEEVQHPNAYAHVFMAIHKYLAETSQYYE